LAGRRNVFYAAFFTAALLGPLLPAGSAEAQTSRHKHHRHHAHAIFVRPQPASYIVDADTGKVMESENADAPRYPASLTKMMTLYLTFDALKKGRLNLEDTLPVSEHAASQPQTNIALRPGDRLAVKDAILSIVVRSANDSAVTLGEGLAGGSEEAFARKMTQKAHALGMKHTVFYNASGLPDPEQHTTARDMATLGLALRRNFPQYFPLFKTESFSYRGLTYVTHNHVMMRYEGVDGIKTGYIRASGYNLVTSATRDNHHIIAVVLGGSTFRARDDRMIALLDKSFADLSALPGNRNRVQYADSGRRIPAFPSKIESVEENMEGEGDRPGDDVISTAALRQEPKAAGVQDSRSPIAADRLPPEPPQQTADTSDTGKNVWAIQVGAFARTHDAEAAANHAIEQAPGDLTASTVSVSDDGDARAVHRARLLNLTQAQAQDACQKLSLQHQPCFVYRVD
jgi:D-alanyl-D-alanine carboxypeptidase